MVASRKNLFDQLFRELACYVGEGILTDAEEDFIIEVEEEYRGKGVIKMANYLCLRQLLRAITGEEFRE